MATMIPLWDEGDGVTAIAATDLTGCRFAAISGARVAETLQVGVPAAGGRVFGVITFDTPAGHPVGLTRDPDVIPLCEVGSTAITFGTALAVDALGRVVPATGTNVVVGVAVDTVAASVDAAGQTPYQPSYVGVDRTSAN